MPKSRTYNPKKKGHIDLGSILLGAIGGAGTGEVEPIPQIENQGPTQEGGILETPPQQFRVKSKTSDYTGRGQEAANRANIEALQSREAEKSAIRTKRESIPIEAEAAKQKELAVTGPLVDRTKLIHQLANDAELQKALKLNPIQLDQARKVAAINVLSAKGIIPTEENITAYNNTLGETQIASELEDSRAKALKASESQAGSRRNLDIEEATRPTDIQTATEKSRFGLEAAKGDRETLPLAIRAKKAQIPLETEQMEYENLRRRLFPMQEGVSLYDIKYPGAPIIKAPTELEKLKQDELSKIQPKIQPIGPGNAASYPQLFSPQDEYETVIIDGQVLKRKKKVLP